LRRLAVHAYHAHRPRHFGGKWGTPRRRYVRLLVVATVCESKSGMASQAPAIVDVRPSGANVPLGLPAWLRGIGVRQVRIACGLVMFSYIFSHFCNHALGNISYATMEWWLRYHIWWWRISIVNFTLYAAAATHFSLGLWALYRAGTFATPAPRSRSSC
jgi:hypothetical protein